ncbi:hypothetical protein [Kribbella sp. VKM Ac-2566]|uniref:hypothetical protein n=1 Tax=Kribbella sp. VKM Ac-2566 TaxID=2512218 RepID=UPI0010645872|nr:hypothetical protein [Kribbella sp. VKM Ac-2566]TDW92409.1 hypothetical protein EV647_4247 [Kribbella sp. VKM Ac-2566]
MSNTLGPQRKRTTAVRRNTRRAIVTINITEAVVALPCLVAAYGLAERLVAVQETAGPHHVASQSVAHLAITLNMSLLIVGAAAGAVGSVIQQSMAFARNAAPDHPAAWYVMRPLWSALLGSVSVIAVNTGLLSIGDDSTSSAAIAVLVLTGCLAGLFTDQVLRRLRGMLDRGARTRTS